MSTHKRSSCHVLHIIISICYLGVYYGAFSSDLPLHLSHQTFTGAEGSEAQVECRANVSSKPRTLKWDSRKGQDFSQYRTEDNSSVKLVIPSLHRYDAGTYTCILVTANGEEKKAELRIFVRAKKHGQPCQITQFKCKKTKHCIFVRYRCDGKDDCGDGSDEECSGDPCANKFLCNNTRCVDMQHRCNHVDNCGDNSDERTCAGFHQKGGKSPTTPDPSSETDENYSWVKSTIYTIIASTIVLVILISIVVILVFRAKMKRIRERRMVRTLNAMQIYGGGSEEPRRPMTGEGCVEQQPFLPRTTQPYHQGPSIIFNVNNGVQYMPRYRYFMENPPPYSEVQGGGVNGAGGAPGNESTVNTPPPYSTLERPTDGRQGTQPANQLSRIEQRNPNSTIDENMSHMGRSWVQGRPNNRNVAGSGCVQGRPPTSRDMEQSLSQGQGPVCEGRRGTDHIASQSSTLNNAGSSDFRGVDINSHFLHNLLASHSGRRPVAESESSGNESRQSSSSSSGDDSAGNTLIGAQCSNRDSIHDVQTLRARIHTVPPRVIRPPPDFEALQSEVTDNLGRLPTASVNPVTGNANEQNSAIESDSLESERSIPETQPLIGANDIDNIDYDYNNNDDNNSNNSDNFNAVSSGLPNQSLDASLMTTDEDMQTRRVSPTLHSDNNNDIHSPSHQSHSDQSSPTHQLTDPLRDDTLPNHQSVMNPSQSSSFNAPTDTNASLSPQSQISPSRLVEINKPKQGHLSVHQGQIVLHTSDGVIAGQTLLPTATTSSEGGTRQRGDVSNTSQPAHLSGEIIVKDGIIMLQIPVGRSLLPTGHIGFPCMGNAGHGGKSSYASSSSPQSSPSETDLPAVNSSSSPSSQNTAMDDTDTQKQSQSSPGVMSGDLIVRDGALVLEPPKHTPSSQILAHLQGAYSHKTVDDLEPLDEPVGPVVNDKRSTSGLMGGHRQPTPKCNSDIVLPRGGRSQDKI